MGNSINNQANLRLFGFLLLAVVMPQQAAGEAAAELNKANFDEMVAGKNVFVKFFAPWCGHCKAIKPAWDSLIEEYAGSSSVLIADVDCTAETAKDLCEAQGVRGYPTLKYWLDGEEKDYTGGRDLDSLKKFVEDSLAVKCDVSNPAEGCNDKEQGYIVKMKDKDAEARKKELERLNKMKGDLMKPQLKTWLQQRVRILTQLEPATNEQEL